jgi:hypothetical protein
VAGGRKWAPPMYSRGRAYGQTKPPPAFMSRSLPSPHNLCLSIKDEAFSIKTTLGLTPTLSNNGPERLTGFTIPKSSNDFWKLPDLFPLSSQRDRNGLHRTLPLHHQDTIFNEDCLKKNVNNFSATPLKPKTSVFWGMQKVPEFFKNTPFYYTDLTPPPQVPLQTHIWSKSSFSTAGGPPADPPTFRGFRL